MTAPFPPSRAEGEGMPTCARIMPDGSVCGCHRNSRLHATDVYGDEAHEFTPAAPLVAAAPAECVCGETSARNYPVHAAPAETTPERAPVCEHGRMAPPCDCFTLATPRPAPAEDALKLSPNYVAWDAYRAGFMAAVEQEMRGINYEVCTAMAEDKARAYADRKHPARSALSSPQTGET